MLNNNVCGNNNHDIHTHKIDNEYLVARLQVDDKAINEIAQLCKEQMSDEIAKKAVKILTGQVVENDRINNECRLAHQKYEYAVNNEHNAKMSEYKSIKSMKFWRTLCILSIFLCIFTFIAFIFAGNDIVKLFGQPGCMSISNSSHHFSPTVQHYHLQFRHGLANICTWFMDKISFLTTMLKNNITVRKN